MLKHLGPTWQRTNGIKTRSLIDKKGQRAYTASSPHISSGIVYTELLSLRRVLHLKFFTGIYLLLYRVADLLYNFSPKIFYKYILISIQNGWARVELFPPNFLLVYIYYYTEWLSLSRVHRRKLFTSIYLLLHRVIELALRSSPNFFNSIYI